LLTSVTVFVARETKLALSTETGWPVKPGALSPPSRARFSGVASAWA